ncbi:TRAP transporter small permease [Acuticoccus sp.]|uniref:TRAP transporter small permease n=1 Tax=Acuticoccus sp. TaxID=1904378 RepID=UPI003B5157D2
MRTNEGERPGWRIGRAYAWVEDAIVLNVAALFMATAIGVMFYEAASRTLVGQSHWWAEEAVRFLVVWSVLMSIGIASRNGHFIRMDLLLLALPRRFALLSAALTGAAGVTFSAVLLYAGVVHVAHLHRIGMMTESSLDLPLWVVRLVLPAAGLLYLLYFLAALAEVARGRDPFATTHEDEVLSGAGPSDVD